MLLLATIHKGVLGPFVSYPSRGSTKSFLPMGVVWIRISFHVVLDVVGCWVTRGIASHALLIRVLVDPDVVESQLGRHQGLKTGEVDVREALSHTKIHHNGHWLRRNRSLPNVPVRTKRTRIQLPNGLIRHIPYNVTSLSGRVVKVVLLVPFPIVPGVIDVGQA